MTQIGLDEAFKAQLEASIQQTVAAEARRAVNAIITDGVEYRAVLNCVHVWAHEHRGIAFAQGKAVWYVMWMKPGFEGMSITDEQGERLKFRSFHELLQWLFDQPELTGEPEVDVAPA